VYYASWDGYTPPRFPVDEIEFDETENTYGFCVATLFHGQIQRLERIELVRKPLRTMTLWEPRPVGSTVYLRPRNNGAIECLETQEVVHAETEHLECYGEALVTAGGLRADVYRIERTIRFTDDYAWHPDGSLASVTTTQQDGQLQHYTFAQ
jgi:hypothetical protein